MKNGFSFISLLITVLIIGVLCVLFLPQFTQGVKKQHTTQINALNQARQLQEQINAQQKVQGEMLEDLSFTGNAAKPRTR